MLRSRAHRRAERIEQADRDLEEALKAENQSAYTLRVRAQARKESDPEGAIADLRQADALDPDKRLILTDLSRILSVRLQWHDEALEVLDRLLKLYPNTESALIDRSILYAKSGRHEEAVRDIERAMEPPNANRTLYQAACAHANFPGRKNHVTALSLLSQAIRAGYVAKDLDTDPDLDPIRDMPGFKAIKLSYQLSTLRQGRNGATDEDAE